jgi:tetratricopeptide (TPR) repeat protein
MFIFSRTIHLLQINIKYPDTVNRIVKLKMMAEKRATTTVEETNLAVLRARSFWDKYSKPIIYAGSAIILIIAGWYGYLNFVKLPKEKKASEAIFPAETLFDKMASASFNKDSVNIVLNGGVNNGFPVTGLLKIINNYGGTNAGNRAKYMAGACYLHIKEYDKAIKYLKDFNDKGAYQVESRAYVLLGHAYAEKNNVNEALDYYKKAATVNEKDESITTDALMLAASYADAMGKSKEAIELYQKLKDKYPAYQSVKSGDVEKHLARLGILK